MEKMKILIFAVLLSAGLLFNGELYMLYLNNFQESCYQANFYTDIPTKDLSDDQIVRDFVRAGEKHRVDFFVVHEEPHSVYKREITVYGTKGALQHLSSMGIKAGEHQSLFFGTAAIHPVDFQDIRDISQFDTYYFVGDEAKSDDIRAFKAELIDQYGGGFPSLEGSERETWLNLLSVWGFLFGLMLLTTLYSILYYKKETMVRIILGESVTRMFAKNAFVDTAAFSLLFLLLPQLLQPFSNVKFRMPFIFLLFCVFLLVNILLNGLILHVNYKKDIAGGHDGRGLIRASYLLKVMTTVLVTLILAGNVMTVREAYNLYQQKDFFERHKGYSYYHIGYKIGSHNDKYLDYGETVNREFYQRFQDRALSYQDVSGNFQGTYPAVLNNQAAMEEVKGQWPSVAEAIKGKAEGKVYVLVPSSISKGSSEYDFAKTLGEGIFNDEDFGEAEMIFYNKGISMPGIHMHNAYEMKFYRDPIILFNNNVSKATEGGGELDWIQPYDVMYRISTEEWASFIEEFQLENEDVYKSNVLDVYDHSLSMASRNVKMTMALSVFLLLLEMALIMFIIRLEYQFNAVEIAVKKVHGYTLLSRNERILKTTIRSVIVGILAALILSRIMEMPGGVPLILSGLLLLALELGYILWRAKKTEKTTISSILKGERI